MKLMTSALTVLFGLAFAAGLNCPGADNVLTDREKAEGWRLLFDGKTTEGWRGYRKQTFPTTGWKVEDGCLKKIAGERGGDIITKEQFEDFELEWDWRLAPKGNNGVKYFVTEQRPGAPGHEYQMIDDSTIRNKKQATASFYDVLPPADHKPIKMAPEWNHSRLVVKGNTVEHWLNGEKVLQYECGSKEVMDAIAKSKFKNAEGFGKKIKGHIMLTDHGSECWFKNIKIRTN
ncbi:MAG: 3-keto-disaccharide hydrolase [Verrucomicrobiia bacterium]